MKTPNNFEEKLKEELENFYIDLIGGCPEKKDYYFIKKSVKAILTLCEEELLLRDLNSRIGEITRAYRFGYITKNYYERAKARNLKLYQENFKRLAELKGKE